MISNDIRWALKRSVRRPGFSAVLVLLLTAGISTTTVMISVLDAVVFQRPPWPDPGRLVLIHEVRPDRRLNPAFADSWDRSPVSWAAWRDLESTRVFEAVGVWMPQQELLSTDSIDLVSVFYCSASFGQVLGLRPHLGRLFSHDEDESVDALSAVLTFETWRSRFGGRDDIIGLVVAFASTSSSQFRNHVIVGVLPPGFSFEGRAPEFLLPIGRMAFNGRFETNRFLRAVGRLARDVSHEQALAAVEPVVRRSDSPTRRTARLAGLYEDMLGNTPRSVWIMLAGAGLLLCVACSSAGALLFSDVRARQKELAVRSALGAGRRDVVRQLVTEVSLLTIVAGAAATTVAALARAAILERMPQPLLSDTSEGLGVSAAITSLLLGWTASLLFMVAPIFAFTSGSDARLLAIGSLHVTPARGLIHEFTVGCGLALTTAVLVLGVLFGETMRQVARQPLGFDPDGLVGATVGHSRLAGAFASQAVGSSSSAEALRDAYSTVLVGGRVHTAGLLEHLATVPDVTGVAAASAAPFKGGLRPFGLRNLTNSHGEVAVVQRQFVTANYFAVMRIAITRGRSFGEHDRQGSPVAVVSETLERRLLGDDALNRQVGPYRVIGIAADVVQASVREERAPIVYVLNNDAGALTQIVVRTSDASGVTLGLLPSSLAAFDDSMLVRSIWEMKDLVRDSVRPERLRTIVSLIYGALAVSIAMLGLYTLAARLVSDRQREFGVRLALGASGRDIRRLMSLEMARVIAIAMALGTSAGYVLARSAASLLFGVEPTALSPYAIAMAVLSAAALLACLRPALTASRIQPAVALRDV